jgi:hypothetical protein
MRGNISLHDEWGVESLLALSEALKVPLVQARSSNALLTSPNHEVSTIIEHALKDIDAFMTATEQRMGQQVSLETIALGSLLEDAMQHTAGYARMRDLSIEIDDRAKHQPVRGHVKTLMSSLELMIKTVADMPSDTAGGTIILRADTRHGYPRLGVYRSAIDVQAVDISSAVRLYAKVKGPVGTMSQLSAMRLAVASRLLASIDIKLRSAISAGTRGIACTLLPSNQLGLFEVL